MSIAELPPETSTPELKIVKDATCTFCGCVCDDMELTVEDNHITKAKNACVLGKSWFFNHPFGVNLGRGYSRFNPGEFTSSDLFVRGEADAALIIASDPMSNFSQSAREHLAKIPSVVLDPKLRDTARTATVAFTTSTYGINTPGTVYRMDDVPIPLRPAFESPYKSDYEILKEIEKRIRAKQLGS